jgi:hypothetical protein
VLRPDAREMDQSRATGAAQSALACRRRSTWRRAFSVAAWDIPDIVAERHQPEAVAAVTVSDRIPPGPTFRRTFPVGLLNDGNVLRQMFERWIGMSAGPNSRITFGCANSARLLGWYP